MNSARIIKTTLTAAAFFLICTTANAQHRRCRPYFRPVVAIVAKPAPRIVNRLSQSERLAMALAYINRNGAITAKQYSNITKLSKSTAEAELDAFALRRNNPITIVVKGKKKLYVKV